MIMQNGHENEGYNERICTRGGELGCGWEEGRGGLLDRLYSAIVEVW